MPLLVQYLHGHFPQRRGGKISVPENYISVSSSPAAPKACQSPSAGQIRLLSPCYIGWTNIHQGQIKGHSQVCWLHEWPCKKHGVLHLGLLWLVSWTCVKSQQEREAMGDQGNINRAGPLRMQSISSIHAQKFHSNRRQCQHLCSDKEARYSTKITRLLTSGMVALCSNVSL